MDWGKKKTEVLGGGGDEFSTPCPLYACYARYQTDNLQSDKFELQVETHDRKPISLRHREYVPMYCIRDFVTRPAAPQASVDSA